MYVFCSMATNPIAYKIHLASKIHTTSESVNFTYFVIT